jgi:hypothetical protein
MAATSERMAVAPSAVSFELERFERVDGRLELRGRWYGVRGMRFVRPTLTIAFDDGSRSRALADLEHKPWAPFDGELWQAAFPCQSDPGALDAELAVAPGIAIPLPAPGDELPDADPIAVLPPAPAEPRHRGSAPARRKRAAVADELAVLREETHRLRQEPIRLRAELDRSEQLRKDVEQQLERLKVDANGAVARRDAAVDRFEDASAERDDALRTRDEAVRAQNEAATRRTETLRERDKAIRARDEALRERDRALGRLRESMTEQEATVRARDATAGEHDKAIAARDTAIAERDAAVAERKQLGVERDRLRRELEKLSSPPHRVGLTHTGAPTAKRAAVPVRTSALTPVFSEDQDQLIKRAVAIALLCVAGLVLLIVLGVL